VQRKEGREARKVGGTKEGEEEERILKEKEIRTFLGGEMVKSGAFFRHHLFFFQTSKQTKGRGKV